MKKIMITVFAVLAVASMAQAGDVKVDFDSANSGTERIAEVAINSQVPEVPGRVRAWDDEIPGGTQEVFIRGNKCNGTDCEQCACSSSCNTKTCGKKAAPVKSVKAPELSGLDKLVEELSAEKKGNFFSSLMFVDGKLASIYTEDVEKFLGKARLSEVLKFFNLKTGEKSRQDENGEDENGDGVIDSDYVRQSKCDGAHNCEPASGYNCTENC